MLLFLTSSLTLLCNWARYFCCLFHGIFLLFPEILMYLKVTVTLFLPSSPLPKVNFNLQLITSLVFLCLSLCWLPSLGYLETSKELRWILPDAGLRRKIFFCIFNTFRWVRKLFTFHVPPSRPHCIPVTTQKLFCKIVILFFFLHLGFLNTSFYFCS